MVIQGVIRPPPEIRAVADRTALYVANNGRAFETRILNSAKGKTPKFAFLQPNNPFHAYYEDRISFYESGGTDDDPKDKEKSQANDKKKNEKQETSKDASQQEKKRVVASVSDPVAKAILTERKKIAEIRSATASGKETKGDNQEAKEETNQPGLNVIPPPPPLHFVNIVAPSSLTVAQIETIQVVAQMTALDGRGGGFLRSLTLREWNNPEFAFCQPRHGLFAYFSALVDAYRLVLDVWTLPVNESNKDKDYTSQVANNTDKCLEIAAYRSEYERDQIVNRKKDANNNTLTVAAIDWQDFVVVETIDFAQDEKVQTLPPPPSATKMNHLVTTDQNAEARGDDMRDDSDEEDAEQIRVVPSYKPKVVSGQSTSTEMVIDPITGKSIAVKDMPEHMRIQLLDPKWAEERKKFQEKQKESNLVGGDAIARNLERFAQARGMNEDALSREDAKKRLQDANRVLREQSLHSTTPVGPALPGAPAQSHALPSRPIHAPPALDASSQPPDSKRPRTDALVPPPAPSAIPTTTVQGPAPDPPTVANPFAAALMSGTDSSAAAPTNLGPPSELLSEAAFAASLPRTDVTLQIRVPNDPSQMSWNFYGQIVSISVDCMSKIKVVKQQLSQQHLNNMPANKIQLKLAEKGVFLKDSMSLAALNIASATLDLVPKTRGGRK